MEDIIDDYDSINVENKAFSIIAKYKEAREVIQELIFNECCLKSIDLHDEITNGYSDEFIITLSSIDEGYEIWCEPMKRDMDYI